MGVMSDFELHLLCKQYASVSPFRLDEAAIMESGKFKALDRILPKLKEQVNCGRQLVAYVVQSNIYIVLWTVVLWTVVLWTVVLWTVVLWTVVLWTVVLWTVVLWTVVLWTVVLWTVVLWTVVLWTVVLWTVVLWTVVLWTVVLWTVAIRGQLKKVFLDQVTNSKFEPTHYFLVRNFFYLLGLALKATIDVNMRASHIYVYILMSALIIRLQCSLSAEKYTCASWGR